jgi:hypothetical protein
VTLFKFQLISCCVIQKFKNEIQFFSHAEKEKLFGNRQFSDELTKELDLLALFIKYYKKNQKFLAFSHSFDFSY